MALTTSKIALPKEVVASIATKTKDDSASKDIDGDVPTIEQVAQASMAPHVEMLKSMAMLCAASMRVPVDYMGITLDNPTSAESQAAAERRLIRIADRQNVAFGRLFTR